MSTSHVSPLVTCNWLKEKITKGDVDNIVILDVSWSSQKDCQKEFEQRHIPGARYINVMTGPHTELLPRNLPTPEALQEAARAAGVDDGSHVIVYSDSDNCGFFMSGRAWWTLTMFGAKRVSILNGGLQRWTALGYPTTSQPTDIKPGNFTARYQSQYRLPFEEAVKLVQAGSCILDSRPSEKYGEGHVPGAKNVPYTRLIDDATKEMMSPDDVRKVLEGAGVDLSKPVTTYCNSGMSSSTMAFVLSMCGASDFTVFHGGFTEWKNKAPDMVEKS